MRTAAIIAIPLIVAAAGVLVFLALHNPGKPPNVRPESVSSCGSCAGNEPTAETPEKLAAARMLQLTNATERIDHLMWVSEQDWARSNSPVLRTTIISDPDESVQLAAVEESLNLALKEGGAAPSEVVRTALASTKGNTRARGLKAAREHPDPKLVPALLELVDNKDPYAAMALTALAHTNSAEAHAKVFEIAQDSTAEPKLRERAVALLAVTKEREVRPLLVELANGEDQTLRRIATEVLRVLNED